MPGIVDVSSTGTSITTTGWVGSAAMATPYLTIRTDGQVSTESKGSGKSGIHPRLYFSYIKSKFNLLERIRIDRRIKALEKAFDHAAESGQDMLARKILNQIAIFAKESVMSAKGIKWKISREELHKHKYRIRGGHISDTAFPNYTRVIPKTVLDKKKKLDDVFDSWVIYHYFSPEQDDVKEMSTEEKEKMRDPVLFGRINESEDLYFVADWEDEYCDLTFDEMLEAMDKEYSEVKLSDKPNLIQE